MEIRYLGDSSFSIKTKFSEISTGKTPKVNSVILTGPGEYEVGDVHVYGFPFGYLYVSEDINVLDLAGLTRPLKNGESVERDVDILLLPVGAGSLSSKDAQKLIADIDPSVVIPAISGDSKQFCDAVGGCPSPVDSFKISKKDFGEGQRRIILLNAKRS
jgi:L-ascorbate metabolism protein UlaG (beta-lactamase superfamily)